MFVFLLTIKRIKSFGAICFHCSSFRWSSSRSDKQISEHMQPWSILWFQQIYVYTSIYIDIIVQNKEKKRRKSKKKKIQRNTHARIQSKLECRDEFSCWFEKSQAVYRVLSLRSSMSFLLSIDPDMDLSHVLLISVKKFCRADMAPMMAGVPKPWVTKEKWVRCRWIDTSKTGARRLFVPKGERSWVSKSVNSLTNCLDAETKERGIRLEEHEKFNDRLTWPRECSVYACRCRMVLADDEAYCIAECCTPRIAVKGTLDHIRSESHAPDEPPRLE